MQPRVLATNYGTHPADKWAALTAEIIIPDDSPKEQQNMLATLRLRTAAMEILTKHHQAAQDHEKQQLLTVGQERFDVPHDGATDMVGMMGELRAAAKGTVWEDHMNKPEVAQAIAAVVHDHVQHQRHIERLWHADRNPHLEAGQAYRARHSLPPSPTRSA